MNSLRCALIRAKD